MTRGRPPLSPRARRAPIEAEIADSVLLRAALEAAEREKAELLIENGRLRGELNEVRSARAERDVARQRLDATAEILRLIAAGPADPQQVFDAVTASAARLFANGYVTLWLRDGESSLRGVAGAHSRDAEADARIQEWAARRKLDARPLHRGAPFDVAILDGVVVQVPDAFAPEADQFAQVVRPAATHWGWRRQLNVPLLREGKALGAITLYDPQVGPWSDQEIALVQTFADQAVIALENARLFSELQERLTEQTATSDVLRVISESPDDLSTVLDTIVSSASSLCDAQGAFITEVRDGIARYLAAWGDAVPMVEANRAPWQFQGTGPGGLAIRTGNTVHITDPTHDERLAQSNREQAQRFGLGVALSVPLVRDGTAFGAITLARTERRPFSDREIARAEGFAHQAVIAIENVRLFQDLQARLEEQTATSEVLRVISASPTQLDPVLQEIAAGAGRLCEAFSVRLRLRDGDELVSRARYGERPPKGTPAARQRVPRAAGEHAWIAMEERRSIHIHDMLADFPDSPSAQGGQRTMLFMPLLRQEEAVGVIQLGQRHVRPFTDAQIRLVETFAAQAVIAIENARLFSELQDSNATLTDALEEQTATSDILRVIATTPDGTNEALLAIAERALALCGADSARVIRLAYSADEPTGPESRSSPDPAAPVWVAIFSSEQAFAPQSRGIPGFRAMAERRTIHIPNLLSPTAEGEEPYDPRWLENVTGPREHQRAFLVVPMLREDHAVGMIIVQRTTPGAFTDRQVAVLETFASQAAIAVENGRLLRELRARDERRRLELERAAAIQQRLLPSLVEGWPGVLDIAVRFRPAVETSGDFYDVLALPAAAKGALEPLQIAVGDVAGKGMAAALVTALARSALHASASMPTAAVAPAGTLRVAAQRLHRDVGSSHFVACALAVVEPPNLLHAGPRLTLSNAAQVPVLLARGGDAREIEPPGDRLPLGARADADYEDAKVDLRPGDVVVFSSDGLVEAPALPARQVSSHLTPPEHTGALFGFARLAASVSHWAQHGSTAEAVAAGIWLDLTAWCGEESPHDDMTLLVLHFPEPAQ